MDDSHKLGVPASRRKRTHSRRELVRGAAAMGLSAATASIVVPPAGGQPATPAVGTPAPTGTGSITRDQYLAEVRQHFSLDPPQARSGHVLSSQVADPITLNPFVAVDSLSGTVLEYVFGALVRPSVIDGAWVPDLADYWEVSADGRTYTFHLNRNATWHDGVPLTAHDVTFTLDAVLDKDSLSPVRSSALRVVDSYRPIDDHTFELVAREPISTLLDNSVGGLSIMPQHIWESVPLGEWGAAPGATGLDPSQVVGSGPFRFGEWASNEHVTIVRNENYFVPDMVPSVDAVTWRVLQDTSATIQALVAGEIDFCGVPPVRVEALRGSNPELLYTVFDGKSFSNYTLNGDPVRVPLFVDPRVRQAMLYALDRDALIDSMRDGYGTRADGIYPTTSSVYAPERVTTVYNYDPARAKSLLDLAGWLDPGDGVRVKNGVRFRAELLYADAGEFPRQIAAYLQQAWREVGIAVEVSAIGFPILLKWQEAGNYQIALNGWEFPDDQGLLYRCDAMPPNGYNLQRICNPEFDHLNDASLFELDTARRRELLIEQGNVVNDAATLGLLFFHKSIVAAQPHLRNFFVNAHSSAGCLPWIWLADEGQ